MQVVVSTVAGPLALGQQHSLNLGGPHGWSVTVKPLTVCTSSASGSTTFSALLVEHTVLGMTALMARTVAHQYLLSTVGSTSAGKSMDCVMLLSREGRVLHSRSGGDSQQAVHVLGGGGRVGGGGGYHIGLASIDLDLGLRGAESGAASASADDDGPFDWLKDVFFAWEPRLLDEVLAKTLHSGGEWR